MSYDVRLVDDQDEVITFTQPHQLRGGTYQVGGTTEAWLNITFNYTNILARVLPGGIPGLNGRTAQHTISALEQAALQLGDTTSPDYWQPTEGNVKQALLGLLALARKAPAGKWKVDY